MKQLLPILILLVGFSSCRKDRNIPFCELHPEDCFDAEMHKDWFCFNEGSYWVYQQESSSVRDSVVVTETTSDTGSYGFSTTVYSHYENLNYRYYPDIGENCPTSGSVRNGLSCFVIKKTKWITGDVISISRLVSFDLEVGNYLINYTSELQDNKVTVTNFYPNYSLMGYNYTDVFVLEELVTFAENNQHTKHYFARNHGLIRKELIDSNEVWNLVDFDLEQ